MENFKCFLILAIFILISGLAFGQSKYLHMYSGVNIASGKYPNGATLKYREGLILGVGYEKITDRIMYHVGIYSVARGGGFTTISRNINGEIIEYSDNYLTFKNIGIPLKIGYRDAVRMLTWTFKVNLIPEYNYSAEEVRYGTSNTKISTSDIRSQYQDFNIMLGGEAEVSLRISKSLVIASSVAYNHDVYRAIGLDTRPVLNFSQFGLPFIIGLKYLLNGDD